MNPISHKVQFVTNEWIVTDSDTKRVLVDSYLENHSSNKSFQKFKLFFGKDENKKRSVKYLIEAF